MSKTKIAFPVEYNKFHKDDLHLNLEIGISTGMILALPIILNEIFLRIWLIVKGFNSSAKTDIN